MQIKLLTQFINNHWDNSIIPTLKDYILIPNKSPHFDSDWQVNGHMDKAIELMHDWCLKQNIPNMHIEVVRIENRTPVIFIEIPGSNDNTILLYGHLDKQPEMSGWDSDLSPWKPVIKGDKLYGRGGADDGYALFASLTAIHALKQQNLPHSRCVILIESCEESGSYDLPVYIDALKNRIGNPNLVICLDSGCGNYEQLWMTTSLRGLIGCVLKIDVLKQGIHSGQGSGIVPSAFLVLRQLLSRIENENNGEIILDDFKVAIPQARLQQAQEAANVLNNDVYCKLPFPADVQPVTTDNLQLILNRTWRAALSITGANGLPLLTNAGNVTLPSLQFKLSMRTSPTTDAEKASLKLKAVLEKNPPFNAKVEVCLEEAASGWNAPQESQWLTSAANQSSLDNFGKPAVYMGEGGSIPFMGMLGKQFPKAQFVITGLLGPGSNAHGPNEFLHIPTGKKLTACIAQIIAAHYKNNI